MSTDHKQAFENYIRKGIEENLRAIEAKAIPNNVAIDSGFLIPVEADREIDRALLAASPIRSISGITKTSNNDFKKPVSATHELQFPTMELYAMPAATSQLLDDAAVDVDAWIASEVEQAFAEQESAAFINGDGVNKPRGFLTHPTADENNWSWGNLGTVSGKLECDTLIDLVYSLKAGYRQNANWVMNRKTQAEVRKLKDVDGNYLWQVPAAAGQAASLMGFGVVEAEDMPDIGRGTTPIAFGDFNRGYLIVDRAGVRVLRDPYSAKPYVLFYTTKRVGGGVQDFDAIKLLKLSN